jgi:heme/copper-type cytochrome/quinol oxidase subunit 3
MQPAVTIDTTGIGKLGIQLLLTAEVMLFSGLIAAFLVLRDGNRGLFRDNVQTVDRWIIPAVVALFVASTSMLRSSVALSRMLICLAMSAAYFVLMAFQWRSLESPRYDIFYACYILLTGAVACHVLATSIATIDAAARANRNALTEERAQCIAMLWHFAATAGVVTLLLLHWS